MDLQKENEDRLWQEGILRHVPVVGTFVNWWSPKVKESGVRGRSLNLTQGIVESTENIYKYHMQIQSGSTGGGSKSPPTPQVQKSVGGSHSRTSSHASSQGTPSLSTQLSNSGKFDAAKSDESEGGQHAEVLNQSTARGTSQAQNVVVRQMSGNLITRLQSDGTVHPL